MFQSRSSCSWAASAAISLLATASCIFASVSERNSVGARSSCFAAILVCSAARRRPTPLSITNFVTKREGRLLARPAFVVGVHVVGRHLPAGRHDSSARGPERVALDTSCPRVARLNRRTVGLADLRLLGVLVVVLPDAPPPCDAIEHGT